MGSKGSRLVIYYRVTPSTVGPDPHSVSPICILNQRSNSSMQAKAFKKRLIQLSLNTGKFEQQRIWGHNVVHILLHFSASFSLQKLLVCFEKLIIWSEGPLTHSSCTMSYLQNTLALHSWLYCSILYTILFTIIQEMHFMFAHANDIERQGEN